MKIGLLIMENTSWIKFVIQLFKLYIYIYYYFKLKWKSVIIYYIWWKYDICYKVVIQLYDTEKIIKNSYYDKSRKEAYIY